MLPRLQHLGGLVVDEQPLRVLRAGAAHPVLDPVQLSGLRPVKPKEQSGTTPRPPGTPRRLASLPHPQPGQGPGRGRAGRAVAKADRGRRVQRPGAGRPQLSWRPISGAARLRQVPAAGWHPVDHAYIERVLHSNTTVTRLLVRLFSSQFNQSRHSGQAERSEAITEEIRGELDDVAILDHDPIVRASWA